jgi:hypothetical protein
MVNKRNKTCWHKPDIVDGLIGKDFKGIYLAIDKTVVVLTEPLYLNHTSVSTINLHYAQFVGSDPNITLIAIA